VPGGAMACGCSGRHVNRPSRRACRTARGRPLVSGDHENPCGRDTRGSAPDFREIRQIRVRREVTVLPDGAAGPPVDARRGPGHERGPV
jgi:hypothetical protein